MRCVLPILLTLIACKTSNNTNPQVETARKAVRRYAGEAFPRWAAANPGKACPDAIDELVPYSGREQHPDAWGNSDGREQRFDPWGSPYVVRCGADVPTGAKAIAIYSYGEDGKDGTEDDIKSW